MPKRGPGRTSGDTIYYDSHFACVIDGATPKSERYWNGEPADAFISNTLTSAIAELHPSTNANDAFSALANHLTEECKKFGCDLQELAPNERPQASIAIYSASRKELWCLGDCCYLLNGREYRNTKRIDRLLSQLRLFAHELNIAGCAPPWGSDERYAILPFLKQQAWLANRGGGFGYGVFDGSNAALDFVNIVTIRSEELVVIATDGYPRLFPTLKQSEDYLIDLLAKDPSCFYELCGTKGVIEGNVSYDDRAYLSFIA